MNLLIYNSLLVMAIVIMSVITMWVIFTKAGKYGWISLVPVYNLIVLLQIARKPWWWVFLFIIPLVNIVFLVWCFNALSKSFGKNVLFTLGLVFLSFIFFPILAFGESEYH